METLQISEETRRIAGILLLALVTVETGGLFLLAIHRGKAAATSFQLAMFRAGHAHAGVLLILGLVMQLFCDAAQLSGAQGFAARSLVPLAAILMPAGFFFSAMGAGRTKPNAWIALLYLGGLSLALGLASLGLGLLA